MKTNSTLLLAVIILCTFKLNNVKAQVNVQDSLALVDLYNSTNGPGWYHHDGWLTKSPISTWYGVTVISNRVTSLHFFINNLNGTLPNSIGNLTAITDIFCPESQLTGSIPSSMGNLINIERLDLDFNKLSGVIPSSFSKLIKLYYLNLNDNNLTGSISFLAKLQNLRDVELAGNQLSGNIPVIKAINLHDILLSHNQLSGSVPTFGKDTATDSDVAIDLQYNKLSGSISHQFDSIIHLAYLFLNNNQLTGKIPASLNKLVDLSALDLSNNQLSGKIPSLDSLKQLSSLNLENNKFTFAGMENIATTFQFAVYSPQAIIHVNKIGNRLSVSAGGTLVNNTYNWYKNGVLYKIKVGNSNLTLTSSGSYYVAVTNSIATALTLYSDTVSYTGLNSIVFPQADKLNNFPTITLYPNPSKTFTTLSFNADGKYSIILTDISGKILQTKIGVANKGVSIIQLDVSNCASGVYLVTIIDQRNKKQVIKLTKE